MGALLSADSQHIRPTDPDVSVIIPTHNRPLFLRDALQSVMTQDRSSWECIVIDDGSDPPVRVSTSDARVCVVRHESPQGPAAAINAGLQLARGRYIAILDDDDLMTPSRIRIALEALEANPDANCHVGAMVKDQNPKLGTVYGPGLAPTERQFRVGTPYVGQMTLKRDIVQEFDVELRVGYDAEWWIRVEPTVVPIISDAVMCVVRIHDSVRAGVTDEVRLHARLKTYSKNLDRLPRWSGVRARHQQRVASAALASGRPSLACRFALAALINQPSVVRAKLLTRSIVGLVRTDLPQ
jgi:glycosyltransferase involved in cell wall biosynthesis